MSTQNWERFEEECYEYLKNKYTQTSFKDFGKHNSNVPDILVAATHDEFFMEIKQPIAQSGQFVLRPANGEFVFSQDNRTEANKYTRIIMAEMNRNFTKYLNAGTSGECINLPTSVFYSWVIGYYRSKDVKYFITKTEDFIIFPTEKLPEYFDIFATYRVKKSGSSNPSVNNLQEIIQGSEGKIKKYEWRNEELIILSALYHDGDKLEGDRYNYQLNEIGINEFKVRRLSNTANANVIFSIFLRPNQEQVKEDLESFENDVRG